MRKILLTAIFASIAATAFAQEIMLPADDFVSTKTRAEVMTEMRVAQAQGLMQQEGDITWVAPSAETPDRAVATIRTEARHAEAVNQFNTVYGPRYRN
jgi:hypothetical protein